MATIAGISLGYVQSEKVTGSAGLAPMSLPDADPEDAYLIPTTGAIVRINISGIKTGSTSELQTFLGYLSTWNTDAAKLSESNISFIGDLNYTGGISVRLNDYSADWVAGNPNMITYSLELINGTAIS